MSTQAQKAADFLALHRPGTPLLMPNAWDGGSAVLLQALGFSALATTSSGMAATFGRRDGSIDRDGVLEHCAQLVAASTLPVSADLESGFAADAEGVAETARLAAGTGLAGFSIEDHTGDKSDPILPLQVAAERVAAAAQAAHSGDARLVLTARAENHLYDGHRDLGDTIARLQAYEQAGADVLYAPGLTDLQDITRVVQSVGLPVNVLALPAAPPVAALAQAGVARISVGGAFAFAALGALVQAATELRDEGTYGFWELASVGVKAGRPAFSD